MKHEQTQQAEQKKENRINILQDVQAYRYCVKSGPDKADWQAIHLDRIGKSLLSALPSGSGINYTWHIDILKDTIVCDNSWHKMNNDGYYTGYIDFRVIIKTGHRTIDGKLDFNIVGRFGKDQDIKEYLFETIGCSLETL